MFHTVKHKADCLLNNVIWAVPFLFFFAINLIGNWTSNISKKGSSGTYSLAFRFLRWLFQRWLRLVVSYLWTVCKTRSVRLTTSLGLKRWERLISCVTQAKFSWALSFPRDLALSSRYNLLHLFRWPHLYASFDLTLAILPSASWFEYRRVRVQAIIVLSLRPLNEAQWLAWTQGLAWVQRLARVQRLAWVHLHSWRFFASL